jgi:hypothetical protein
MTKLAGVLKREVTGMDGKTYIITLTAEGVMMREKNRRTQYGPLDYSFLHFKAAAQTVEADRVRSARSKRVSRSLI